MPKKEDEYRADNYYDPIQDNGSDDWEGDMFA